MHNQEKVVGTLVIGGNWQKQSSELLDMSRKEQSTYMAVLVAPR